MFGATFNPFVSEENPNSPRVRKKRKKKNYMPINNNDLFNRKWLMEEQSRKQRSDQNILCKLNTVLLHPQEARGYLMIHL